MKKCAILVDSSFGIKNGQYPDVYVCPLIITVNDHGKITSYHDEVDIFNKDLCDKLSVGMDVKTSQPIPGEVIDMFETLSKDYDEVYALSITKTISGTYNTWKNLASEFKNVYVYDQTMTGRLAEWTIRDFVEKNKKHELNNQFILDYLEKAKVSRVAGLIVPDIQYLKNGGRISNFKSILVKMLGLKLIITLDAEGLIFRNKSMTNKEAVKKMKKEIDKLVGLKSRKIKRFVLFTNAMNNEKFNIAGLIEWTKQEFSGMEFEQTQLPAVLTAHTGPNYMAVGIDLE